MGIGRLERVPLQQIWPHEERDFTPWLESNLEVLADAIGLSLTAGQREKAVGSFEVDLEAEDDEGRRVVIEVQLRPTDHDHLGKLVTYLTNLEAKVAIWICSAPRPEHVRAVEWLNEVTPEDTAFYLVRLDGYRIGDSEPAPLFTPIVAPSPETKDLGEHKKELAERHHLRRRFWEQLLERAKERGVGLHAHVSPSTEHWLSAGAGKAGLSFSYVVWLKDKAAVELYIDTGDQSRNKAIFDRLYAQRERIEQEFGRPLVWERLDARRASRVRYVLEAGGLGDGEDRWPAIQDAMVDAMDRLARALKPHIAAVTG